MRELDLTTAEAIEYAKLNSNVVQPSRQRINPYYLGIKIFEDIEERYNNPTEEMLKNGVKPGSGREKMFEVREIESDQSFIRNYLTKDLVNREDLFLFERKGDEVVVSSKDWEDVRDQLVASRVNAGYPYLVVENGDYMKNGELYLVHRFEGQELDIHYLEKVLMHVHTLWGRTVHLESMIEDKKSVFSCDGTKVHRKRVD